MTTPIYEITLKVFCPYDPTGKDDSEIMADAECGSSMVVHRAIRIVDANEVEEHTGDFFSFLLEED